MKNYKQPNILGPKGMFTVIVCIFDCTPTKSYMKLKHFSPGGSNQVLVLQGSYQKYNITSKDN